MLLTTYKPKPLISIAHAYVFMHLQCSIRHERLSVHHGGLFWKDEYIVGSALHQTKHTNVKLTCIPYNLRVSGAPSVVRALHGWPKGSLKSYISWVYRVTIAKIFISPLCSRKFLTHSLSCRYLSLKLHRNGLVCFYLVVQWEFICIFDMQKVQ